MSEGTSWDSALYLQVCSQVFPSRHWANSKQLLVYRTYLSLFIFSSNDFSNLIYLNFSWIKKDLWTDFSRSLRISLGIHLLYFLKEYLILDVSILSQLSDLSFLVKHQTNHLWSTLIHTVKQVLVFVTELPEFVDKSLKDLKILVLVFWVKLQNQDQWFCYKVLSKWLTIVKKE